jgi:hypothetical protein
MSARPSALQRPDIVLKDGRVFAPVDRIADEQKVHPRTVKRKTPVVYVAGFAYAERDTALLALVGEERHGNKRKARGRA